MIIGRLADNVQMHGVIILSSLVLSLSMSKLVKSDSFNGEVTRALFTTNLKNNRPLNEVLILENNRKMVYFFSEVKNMQGKTISHRWEHRGEKVFEQKFKITKKIQKLISKFKLNSDRTGEWMVIVSDKKGLPIKAVMFKYVKHGSFAGKGVVPIKK